MKVLMYGWEFPPHNSGGLGTACYGLTQALVQQHIDVHFVLPREIPLQSDWMPFSFAEHGHIDMKSVYSLLSPYLTPTEYMRRKSQSGNHGFSVDLMGEVVRYAQLAGDIAREVEHDIIHVHDWMTYMAGIEARKKSSAPLIMHVHSTEFDRSGGSVNPAVHEVEHESFKKADHIIAVSEYTKNILHTKYGVKRSRVDVVHNGVTLPSDPTFESIKKDEILELKKHGYTLILYTGRFTLHKGLDYLIRALQKVIKVHPRTKLVLVGSGEKEFELIELASHLGLSQHVVFAGWMRGKNLARMYESADIYVQPSVSEPFGISPLEALTHHTPVIVSKQSGVSEGLHNALKVDFWDVDGLAEKLIALISYPSLYTTLRNEGFREVKSFQWSRSADQCRAVYQSLM